MNKDLSISARKFFALIYNQKHEHQIVLSTHVLEELGNKITSERYREFFGKYKTMFIKVDYSDDELLTAQKQSSEDYKDALHCIIANREKVDVIITQNVSHFKQFTTIEIWRPFNFINQFR
jgi:predicted nucleic acid-binding protein